MAIPFNPLLWGCESWAMFHLRCIRRILGIRWTNVIDFNITNDRKKINKYRISNSEENIGRIIRMPNSKIPARLISASCNGNRPLHHKTLNIKQYLKIIPILTYLGLT